MKVKKRIKREISKASELPNFPYKDFEEFKEAALKGEIEIGVAMDIARQWLMNGGKYSSKKDRNKAHIYMLTPYIFAIFLLGYSILTLRLHYLLLFIPLIISLFTLTPMGLRFMGIMNLVVGGGVLLFLYTLFVSSSAGLFLLSLTIVVPWFSLRLLYKLSASVARREMLEHEDLFIAFTKAKAVSAHYPTTGERLWFDKDWDKHKDYLKDLETKK